MGHNDNIERLSLEEQQLIQMIRNNKFQSLKVIKKNGKIDMLEGVERIEKRMRIVDVLNQHDYQNIEIKQANGVIVSLKRTVRTKFN